MRWTCLLVGLCLLTQTGCGKNAAGTEVRFLIIANGIIDKAIKDGKLPAVVFPNKNPSELTFTRVENADRMNPGENPFGFKPGTYRQYTFPVSIGKLSFADAGILVDAPLPVSGSFRLSNIQSLGSVELTGHAQNMQINGAGYRAFSATLEPDWKGPIENKAPGGPFDAPLPEIQ
jgi:hypothetical protein